MQAKLNTGEFVELTKDCGCLSEIHDGPHWLHSDAVSKRLNHEILERAERSDARTASLLMKSFSEKESDRLREKLRHMQMYNIERIIIE